MPGRRQVTDRQIVLLLEFLEERRDLALGRFSNTPMGRQSVARQWEELALILNAVGVGATKSGAKWRDYWIDKKYAARKRATMLRQHALGTGGGSGLSKLTEIEERILALIGKVSVEGEESVKLPFLDPSLTFTSSQSSSLVYQSGSPSVTAQLHSSGTLGPSTSSQRQLAPAAPPPPTRLHDQSPAQSQSPLNRSVLERAGVPRWAMDLEMARVAAAEKQAQALEKMEKTLDKLNGNAEKLLASMQRIESLLQKQSEK